MTTEKTACILCSRNCGLEVEVEDGQLKKFRGDEAHPGSKGYICNKAARLNHYQNHTERLQHPLKRQPDGSFARVSWDDALADIAQRLSAIRDTHGGDAFALQVFDRLVRLHRRHEKQPFSRAAFAAW